MKDEKFDIEKAANVIKATQGMFQPHPEAKGEVTATGIIKRITREAEEFIPSNQSWIKAMHEYARLCVEADRNDACSKIVSNWNISPNKQVKAINEIRNRPITLP